ncbi:MAG TPA: DUF3046 domain-containing protein [Dermatophilaceae bacterium]|jgi:hypothetical protein|nr:DUF3046 domain-containing protein [Actinomycetales bacterium]HMT33275.1 DUF3046 domain-containing protein [Dermatophilaceae bacterium]HMT90941.1 DUF3046 domain-containing protein [Dermatophilaceae bacterium]
MRHSELWTRLRDEFGPTYAVTLAQDHYVTALGNRTAQEALADGIPPRQIWEALCEDLGVPTERRLGREPKRRS